MMNTTQSRANVRIGNRIGATLVEVAIATMLLSVLIVPAIKLVGQSRDMQRKIADENELTWHTENTLDRYRIESKTVSTFDRWYNRGYRTISDLESLSMSRVRAAIEIQADTSVPAGLLTVVVETWNDDNNNRTRDGDEPFVRLRTQVSKP